MASQQLKPADVKTHELSCLESCGPAVFVQARLPLTSSWDAVHQGAVGWGSVCIVPACLQVPAQCILFFFHLLQEVEGNPRFWSHEILPCSFCRLQPVCSVRSGKVCSRWQDNYTAGFLPTVYSLVGAVTSCAFKRGKVHQRWGVASDYGHMLLQKLKIKDQHEIWAFLEAGIK